MTELDIIMVLANHGDHIRRYEIMLPNVFIQADSEADLLGIRKSGFCDEFEVKTSRADFMADKKKMVIFRQTTSEEYMETCHRRWEDRHLNPWYKPKHQALIDGDMPINYFWFAVAEGVADIEDVPAFAGLIIIREDGLLRIKKTPERLHNGKMTIEDRYKIARKSTYRFWNLKNQVVGSD